MQGTKGKVEVLRELSEDIRKAAMKKENVEVGMVVRVKSGNVPNTTSGEVQRRLARDELLGDSMKVVFQMKFVFFGKLLQMKFITHYERKKIVNVRLLA